MAKKTGKKIKTVFQLNVSLKNIGPPIWRRLLVTGDTRLSKLHEIIQVVMDWDDSHLHEFKIGDKYYARPKRETYREILDEKRVSLNKIITGEKQEFEYLYDFGDCWAHNILVEKVLPFEDGIRYPACLNGKRSAPPEDCGDYEYFLEVLEDPEHPDHEHLMEWSGGNFDPEFFGLDRVQKMLNAFIK